jgi:hypothetical protein
MADCRQLSRVVARVDQGLGKEAPGYGDEPGSIWRRPVTHEAFLEEIRPEFVDIQRTALRLTKEALQMQANMIKYRWGFG